MGHWKRIFSAYIVTLDPNRSKNKRKRQVIASQSFYIITLYNFSVCDTTTWVLDIGSPINICNSLQGLQVSKKFWENEQFLNVGDKSLILVLTLETLQLVFKSSSIILDDYHYCPSFLMNVISIDLLAKLGFKFIIKNNFYDIIINDTAIMRGQLKHGIYIISRPVSVMYTPSKCPKIDNVSESYLWHCRLGMWTSIRLTGWSRNVSLR